MKGKNYQIAVGFGFKVSQEENPIALGKFDKQYKVNGLAKKCERIVEDYDLDTHLFYCAKNKTKAETIAKRARNIKIVKSVYIDEF